jgi:predicted GIY-YIG superfamily endonuclease
VSIPTSVYQYRDENGLLIYVGITSRGTTRQAEHSAKAEWWPFVRSQQALVLPEEALR